MSYDKSPPPIPPPSRAVSSENSLRGRTDARGTVAGGRCPSPWEVSRGRAQAPTGGCRDGPMGGHVSGYQYLCPYTQIHTHRQLSICIQLAVHICGFCIYAYREPTVLMASQQGCAEPSKVANCSEHHGVPLLPGKRRAKSGRGRGRRCPTAGHKLTDRDGTDTSCKVALRGVHPRERTRGDGWSPWACIAHPVGQRGGRPVPETVPAVADSLREPKAATAQPTMSARVSRPAEAGWRDGSLQPGRPTGLSSGRHRPERGRGRVERDSGAGQHCGHGGIRVPSAHGRPGKELIHLDVLTSTQQDAQPLCVQFDAFARGCARPSGQFSKSNNRLCNSPDPTAFRPPSGVPGCSDCWPTGYKSGLPPPLLGLAKHTYYFLEQNKEKRYKKRLKTVEENQH
ncbi:uncharacterized protein LOC106729791 isoform X2 [Camelus ferus]|uniref:Uncharacterized protein LOC106729791 isoform X2 n=1 Tax=Camelus ferus TaxID=419612 RepID=A0A8B8SLR0_CAMFR|nr:uncharacterized protein LOC106729791 isoform X2 [Camelus ferus]